MLFKPLFIMFNKQNNFNGMEVVYLKSRLVGLVQQAGIETNY